MALSASHILHSFLPASLINPASPPPQASAAAGQPCSSLEPGPLPLSPASAAPGIEQVIGEQESRREVGDQRSKVSQASDDVWQRGDKFARGVVPEPKFVQVKSHVREVPAKPKERCLVPESLTLDSLVSEYRKAQGISTFRALLLGALSEHWVREQLAKGTALDRATAIKKIRLELDAAKLDRKEAKVDLYIRCHWVAVLLGGWRADDADSRAAANTLSFSALRLFPILLRRDRASDKWELVPQYAAAARTLWEVAVSQKLSAQRVDEALSKILPARSIPIRKHRPIRLSSVERVLARLKPEDLPKVHGLVDSLAAKRSAIGKSA